MQGSVLGILAACWGFIGVCYLLGSAIYRLSFISFQLTNFEMNLFHWTVIVFWVGFMGYFEGYKGFQKGFSPRVAARIRYLSKHVTWKRLVFAPFFCLGFFDAALKRRVFVFCLTILIFIIVQFVEKMPLPWRGILDTGVVVGLSWGLIALVIYTYKAFLTDEFSVSAEVPEATK